MKKPQAFPFPNTAVEPVISELAPEPAAPPALPHYLWLLRRHWWKMLGAVALCVGLATLVSTRLTRVFESIATVAIDRQMPAAVVGQDAATTSANDADQFMATQVNLIQSDAVLRPVALQYHLLNPGNIAAAGVSANSFENAPILLKNLRVTRVRNTYLFQISYRSPDPRLAADVANAVARSYVDNNYDVRLHSSAAEASFMEKQLEGLKAKMEGSSAALMQFERDLDVINPEQKTSIISARLLQLNTEFTNAQGDRIGKEAAWKSVQDGSLESAQVSTQGENLKALAAKLDEVHQKLAEVQTRYDVNHPEYSKAAAQVAEVESQLRDSRKNAASRVEIEFLESVGRENMLAKAVASVKEEFDHLNARGLEYQAIKREADADQTLYEELIHKIKQAGINAGFQNSSIRIADLARAAVNPVLPILWLNVALALVFSSLISVGAVVISDLLDKSVRDSDQIGRLFHLPVIGTLPFVTSWRRRSAESHANEGTNLTLVLPDDVAPIARERSVTGFEEAVRALRNSILLGAFDRPLKSLMITSATPAEGKTTAAIYLAIAHAQLRHKTLLIDCNFRSPGVQTRLQINPETGLSAVVQKNLPWREGLVAIPEFPDLDILAIGQTGRKSAPRKSEAPGTRLDILPCRRGADVIGAYLPKILKEAAEQYDLVVVDCPPILGLPEPLQMSAAVDGVIVVVKAGGTDRTAVSSALDALHLVNANVIGLILNELTSETSDSHHYAGYYEDYKKYYKSA